MKNEIQLRSEIRSIVDQLVEKYQPEKVILFGSAVRNEWGKDSDLDFCIIKTNVPEMNLERRWQVRKLIKKSVPVDFLVYKPEEFEYELLRKNPFFLTLLKEGEVLYG